MAQPTVRGLNIGRIKLTSGLKTINSITMDNQELQIRHEHLKKKVLEMLDTQQLYFKTRDVQVLKKSKALESEVRELINPKKKLQAELEWLGQ